MIIFVWNIDYRVSQPPAVEVREYDNAGIDVRIRAICVRVVCNYTVGLVFCPNSSVNFENRPVGRWFDSEIIEYEFDFVAA